LSLAKRARSAVKVAAAVESTDKIETTVGRISIGSMHLAKSSEFRAVAVMACDEEVNPLQGADRIRDAA
jgi:superfamily I DNA/RNA helicase